MSKTWSKSASWGIAIGSLAAALVAAAGCATKSSGDGSESHFLCQSDADCAPHGASYRCEAKECVVVEGGANENAGGATSNGGGTSSGGARTGGSSGTTGNGGSGPVEAGAGGNSATPTCPPNPHYYPRPGDGPDPSPLGYVDGGVYGCYRTAPEAPAGWITSPATPCEKTSFSCTYSPAALPCGACRAGDTCQMDIAAVCDCGQGPFVDIYDDGWGCKCESGHWDCRVVGRSGSSCFNCTPGSCANETRSTPYSPGMEISGTDVTVALSTSVPAPPAVGDNHWTLKVKTAGGGAITGATLSVTLFMPDHAHPSPKPAVVTEIGNGDYDANPVNFNMAGYWETQVDVKKGTLDETVVIKLCVE